MAVNNITLGIDVSGSWKAFRREYVLECDIKRFSFGTKREGVIFQERAQLMALVKSVGSIGNEVLRDES